MVKNFKYIFKNLILCVLLLVTVFSVTSFGTSFNYAKAENFNVVNLDVTDPLKDLQSEHTFDIANYPFEEDGELQLHLFSEYCYSPLKSNSKYFAIYLYLYNPAKLTFKDSTQNKISMSVGSEEGYTKYSLKLCGYSFAEGQEQKFYKFKVEGDFYDKLSPAERVYKVAGVELSTVQGNNAGIYNASDYKISKTFKFSGFSKGFGNDVNAESTLKCLRDDLETVTLDVNHTYWRSKDSNKGVGYQNQIDTVYFAVPNELLQNYGKLQRIKAEWYEYLTKDIIVTSNEKLYNGLNEYVGTADIDDYAYSLRDNLSIDYLDYVTIYSADWIYNSFYFDLLQDSLLNTNTFDFEEIIDTIHYLFPTKDWESIENYDPYAVSSGSVAGNDLYDYILNYDKSFLNGKLDIKDGQISADLFQDDIQEERKIDNEYGTIQKGYSFYDFDADVDLFNLSSYKPGDHTFRENKQMYGFWDALFGRYGKIENDYENQSPIIALKQEDLSGTEEDISDRLLVNFSDVDDIRKAFYDAVAEDKTLFLFRFATSDYLSKNITGYKEVEKSTASAEYVSGQTYRARQNVYLDFDIIQLTFKSENQGYTIIPCISNPIDIVDGITPPSEKPKDTTGNLLLAWAITIGSIVVSILLIIALAYFSYLIFVGPGTNIKSKIILILSLWLLLALGLTIAGFWLSDVVIGFGGLL